MIIFIRFKHLFSKPIYIFIISVSINVLLFTLFFCFISPRFQTNDDIAIMEFAAGMRTGQPSEYLIYINVIIGKLLSFLYLNFPFVNWYPIFFYLIHFISMTIILYCFLLNKKNIYGVLIFLLVFSFLELYLLTNLQFTTTAFIAGLAGFILLITYLDEKGKKFYPAMIISILLLTVSGLIRRSTFYLLLVLCAVIFGLKFLEKKSWKIPVILIIIVLLFGLFNLLNDGYYRRDENWDFYLEYNNKVAKINSYPYFAHSENNKNVYDSVGWSSNDVTMFRTWFFCDPDVYSIENLDQVVSDIRVTRGIKETFATLEESFFRLDLRIKWFTGFFLIIAILLLRRDKNKYVFSIIFSSFIVSIYLSYLGRLPDWVFSPIVIFTGTTAAFFLCTDKVGERLKILNNKIFKLTIFIICIALATYGFISILNESKINITKQQELDQVIERLSDEEKIYIIWGATGLEDKTISFSIPPQKNYLNIIQLGWMINSPYYNKALDKYSIDDIYKAIVDRDDIFVICSQGATEMFSGFVSEHYKRDVIATMTHEIEGFPVNVYEFNE